MKRRKIRSRVVKPQIVRLGDQIYGQSSLGQMVRIDPGGRAIPRVRMSKKEKLRLRKELHQINEMDSHELAHKIIENAKSVPVVNPKSDEQLSAEKEAAGMADA